MSAQRKKTRTLATGVAMAMLLVGGVGLAASINIRGINLSKTPIYPEHNRQLSNLPTETKSWMRMGSDKVEASEILEVLGTENYLTREYIEKDPASTSTGRITRAGSIRCRMYPSGALWAAGSSRQLLRPWSRSRWIPQIGRLIDRSLRNSAGSMARYSRPG
jgi:hypothetical protein